MSYTRRQRQRTNRVINEVLPTDCSPRKTSLYFFSGFEAEIGVEEDDMVSSGVGNEGRYARALARGRAPVA